MMAIGAPHDGPVTPPAPLATIAKVKNAFRLIALDRRAVALGLKPMTALADARAMHPVLSIHDADPDGDAATLVTLVDWCRFFTPLAAADGPDGAVLDVSGATHLFGGETAMMDTMVARLARQGFFATVAMADGPSAAWALARYGGDRRHIEAALDAREHAKIFAPMPLAALRLDERSIGQLGQAGLRRVGDLLLRPRAPIAARFGPDMHRRLDALLGCTREPISPRFETPALMAERRFADGIARREDIESTILALSYDLCGLLARHGEGARVLDVTLFRVDGVVKHLEAGTSRPLRDPLAMARLFRERIEAAGEDGLDTGYGFEVVRLAARSAERLDQIQPGWDLAGTPHAADLAYLIDRLGARFGLARVARLQLADTHQPEAATVALPAAASPPQRRAAQRGSGTMHCMVEGAACTRPGGPTHLSTKAKTSIEAPAFSNSPFLLSEKGSSSLPERPIRLLERPEPIEAVAAVPDGPPLRFRWRRVLHQVAAIEGPERIGPDWWKQGAGKATMGRDYFRAEDTDGRRFWLYREGQYHDAPTPRWYLHGFFA